MAEGDAVAVEKPVITFDFSDWKQKDKRAFIAAQVSNDDAVIYPFIARSVVAWPWALDPKVPENYDELGIDDFREVAGQFVAALKKRVGQG